MRLAWAEVKVAGSNFKADPMVNASNVALSCTDSTVVDWKVDERVDLDL